MLAIDTNIVVRYLTGDHPEQSAKAKALIDRNDVFVGATVLLEAEWVLRSVYGFDARPLAQKLAAFCGLQRVTVEDPPATARALRWAADGLDFADALHLAKAQSCDAFISFDNRFAKVANTLSDVKVRSP